MKIPKIIHQIWGGPKPLPINLAELSETWKEYHPDWKYEFWDDARSIDFVQHYHPQYIEKFIDFPFNIQRWDAIRYLILDKIGGVYTDFDSECLMPHDDLLKGRECCFSMEREEYGKLFNKDLYFNNAFMASVPNHPFMKEIIKKVFQYTRPKRELSRGERITEIMTSTGPLFLVNLYEAYSGKDEIFLIPPKYTSPLIGGEIKSIMEGCESEELELKLQDAFSVHYFFNAWVNN